jgi:DUF971 family protein
MSIPLGIKALHQEKLLQITWADQGTQSVSYRELRGNCPCAVCVNEMTGQRKFFPENAAEDIHPEKLELIGNYAIKIVWSDSHSTGLFGWELLKKLTS